jgi:phage terminase large subunit-like protein
LISLDTPLTSWPNWLVHSALQAVEAEQLRREQSRIETYYPDAGPYRRQLYEKHLLFFRLGAQYRERMLMAANRVGKSTCGAYETTLHLTGMYPAWWEGRRFTHAISGVAAGDSALSVRDVLQQKLCGKLTRSPGDAITESVGLGTGMIPKAAIHSVISKPGLPNAIEMISVSHVSGGISTLKLRSYEQGAEVFRGSEEHWVWVDEECPQDVYSELLTRTMTVNGSMISTFTPLAGVTSLVRQFMEHADRP